MHTHTHFLKYNVIRQERIMREKGLKEKEREALTHLIELARLVVLLKIATLLCIT